MSTDERENGFADAFQEHTVMYPVDLMKVSFELDQYDGRLANRGIRHVCK